MIIPIKYVALCLLLINNYHDSCYSFQHGTLLQKTVIKPNTSKLSRKPFSTNTQIYSTNTDNEINSQSKSSTSSSSPEATLDNLLDNNKLKESIIQLKSNPNTKLNKDRFINIFKTIEYRTSEADENLDLNNQQPITAEQTIEYPTAQSESRMEMTDMYSTMKELGHLRLYGATRNVLPAEGSKVITPTLLEQVTELSMKSLTPKPTGTLLIAGVILGLLEGVLSLYLQIPLEAMVIATIVLGLLDKLLVNGAVFETFSRLLMPGLSNKILRHEAGHFLVAYLIGCPVEGCVLSSWAALQDARFGGQRNSLSAGTSFFDPDLSEQVNGKKPLSRDSIDRFTMVVMAGIAAEAINFGQADGGAGDEMSLIRFLGQIRPRSGTATPWTTEGIRNQARWGALQAVLMLKEYKSSYEALVDALERGGGLGECIYAIESAARQENLYELNKPLGYVLDKGLYGEWSLENEEWKPAITSTNITNGQQNGDVKPVAATTPEVVNIYEVKNNNDTTKTSEELLKEYRNSLEQRLKDVDEKLNNL